MDLRALVVCPDQDAAGLLPLILSELEMTAEHTPSISRGLELLDSESFDAIVFDYRADESSEEFLASLRRSNKNHGAMLVAIVDGEFNARLVFVLGASFVLYRPLSSERTRISLRAARGLLRRERRRAPRTSLSSSANVAYPGAPELSAVLTDLSDGGTSFQTGRLLPSSSKVYFEFALPGQKQLVRLSGEVAWQDADGRTGIRFVDVPQASRRLMQTWLQRNGGHPATGLTATPAASESTVTQSLPPQSEPNRERRTEAQNATLVSNAGNRRKGQRFACKIGTDVYGAGSSVPNRCTLSDIGEGGCYVEMPSPLAGHSGVEILIRTADTKFKIKGQVLATHPGFGMGVRFTFRDSGEREEIMRLLAVLSAGVTLDEQTL